MPFGLSSEQKLRCKAQFDCVFKHRKRLYGRSFLLYHCPNQQAHARLGIIASKRNVRFAVDRNRIRRLIKEQFRLQQNVLLPIDAVFVVNKGSAELTNTELTQCIRVLLSKLSTGRKKAC